MIHKELRTQIENYAERYLTFFSDLEFFRWKALGEMNPEVARQLPRPQARVLVDEASSLFDSEDAANSVQ